MFKLREYQKNAVQASLDRLRLHRSPGLVVLPTGSGKSLVIANICLNLDAPVIVLQPSKEILEQNFRKLLWYDPHIKASIFSASMNSKRINKITFATIGSVVKKKEYFRQFKYIIIDECHLVNPKGGQYDEFIRHLSHCGVIGLTATPFRLYSNSLGSELRFTTRTNPRIFTEVINVCQIAELSQAGYLVPLKYYEVGKFDTSKLRMNSTGADFTDVSVKHYYKQIQFENTVAGVAQRLVNAGRKAILIFTRFREESDYVVNQLNALGIACATVSGETPARQRDQILSEFKKGRIKVVTNVGVLTTGFDFPELDTVVLARPTKSLGLYYQIVGRAIRPHETKKEGWIVDLCGTYKRFGRVEDLVVCHDDRDRWVVKSQNKILTNKIID